MAEYGAIARGHQSGNEESVLTKQLRRERREHASMEPMQPGRPQGTVDR
jgi:hypothetical protein